jgi:HEPN domain-containing protein
MQNGSVNIEKTIEHWISRSDKDFETMKHLFETKDYHWALFMGHMVIERILKAAIVKKTGNYAPFLHDLRRLAHLSELEFDEEKMKELDTITTFNLNARYDDYIHNFYVICTADFTGRWIEIIKELRVWIKMRL